MVDFLSKNCGKHVGFCMDAEWEWNESYSETLGMMGSRFGISSWKRRFRQHGSNQEFQGGPFPKRGVSHRSFCFKSAD